MKYGLRPSVAGETEKRRGCFDWFLKQNNVYLSQVSAILNLKQHFESFFWF